MGPEQSDFFASSFELGTARRLAVPGEAIGEVLAFLSRLRAVCEVEIFQHPRGAKHSFTQGLIIKREFAQV